MFELNERESEVVLQVLRNTLGDLRMEINKTENYDWRQAMKQDEEVIKQLISRLEREPATNPTPT